MLFPLLLLLLLQASCCVEKLPSPESVYVNNTSLIWSPATQHNGDTKYTVLYQIYDSKSWTVVPSCVGTPQTSCDITRTQEEAEYRCVMLRVTAQAHNLTSQPAEACNRIGHSCGPSVQLSTGPGSLSVQINSSPTLEKRAAYRIYYGLEGQPVQEYNTSTSSVNISELAEGQTYCVYVQCFLHNRKFGPPSCRKCEVIPSSEGSRKRFGIISAVAVFFLLVIVFRLLVIVKKWHKKKEELAVVFSNSGNENRCNNIIEQDLKSNKETDITSKMEQGSMPNKEIDKTSKEEQGLMSAVRQ